MIQSLHINTGKGPDRKSRRLIVIAWLFVTIIVFVLAFTYYSIALLSAGRAYVGGEGLWSKAQKDMIYSIARYARYHDESYYRSYLDSLAICQGDRRARLELEKQNPDLLVAFAGFLQGGNHPDDINGMIRLFRNFRHIGEIGKAIDIWTHADDDIDKLTSVAEQIHIAVKSGVLDDTKAVPYLQQIYQINQHLRPMEDEFSYTLGAAARKTQTLLLIIMFAVVSVLLVGAFMFSQRLLRQSESIQRALRDSGNQLRSLLQFAPLPIVIVHMSEETILYANDRALQQFKVEANSLSRLHVSNFYVRSADRDQLLAAMHGEGSLRDWEVQLRDAHGAPFWALFSSQRIFYNGQDCVLT
ncbi:MAG TPA: PAS domain-containing protein, partial [Burkholderiaceae bacterium]|nr:PAS domain-containing protein [Burkholderiaceae bacterium]